MTHNSPTQNCFTRKKINFDQSKPWLDKTRNKMNPYLLIGAPISAMICALLGKENKILLNFCFRNFEQKFISKMRSIFGCNNDLDWSKSHFSRRCYSTVYSS